MIRAAAWFAGGMVLTASALALGHCFSSDDPSAAESLRQQQLMERLDQRIEAARLEARSAIDTRAQEEAAERARLEASMHQAAGRVDETRAGFEDRLTEVTVELSSLRDVLSRSSEDWARRFQSESQAVSSLQMDVMRVESEVRPDMDRLNERLIHPAVQVDGQDTVGGGTIIHAEAEGESFIVHVLTAFHVIQKIVQRIERHEPTAPVEVKFYRPDRTVVGEFEAEIVAYEAHKDIALLRIRTPEPPTAIASLASRERLHEIGLFTEVYAIGCPLGHDPMPSDGEVSSTHKVVNGESFWMVSAPTIFGNSGGGIFARDSLEMIGLSALICTYDGVVSTPVPHMSIMVNMETVYDWLDELGLQHLYQPHVAAASE